MLRLTVAVLAVVLAGTASAAGWRKLTIDASSEAAFSESVTLFQDKLSPSRRLAFERSLQDVWREGTERATAEQRDYTAADYLRDLHGLGYEEVVRLTDPTGKRAKAYRAQYYYARSGGAPSSTTAGWGPTDRSIERWTPDNTHPSTSLGLTGPGMPGDPRYPGTIPP
jgi:hypothetical protein